MHAIRRVCHLARVCRLPHRAAASGRRLLRLLFLRFGQMSAGATGDVLLWQRWHIGLVAFLANAREYADGDIETDARYYRAHFSKTLRRSDQLESIVRRLRSHFTPQDIVKARAIEERLYSQTWRSPQYDVSARLRHLKVPTLIINGDYDLIPLECAKNVADALPRAGLVVLGECGHFSYLERPSEVLGAIAEFAITTPVPR